jgi:integrase
MAKLSDTSIRAAKPRAKAYKLRDGDGLFLIVTPSGGRWWRCRYTWRGREQMLSLGTYPGVTLAAARDKRDALRAQIEDGINPSAQRRQERAVIVEANAPERTYAAVAARWLDLTASARRWTDDHRERVLRRQQAHAFPWLGKTPVADVTEADVLACLNRVTDSGIIDTAHRLRADTYSVFVWARRQGYIAQNPCADLHEPGTLPRLKTEHNAAITDPRAFGVLLQAIDGYPASFTVRAALKLQALTFVRPGELRLAIWAEFNLDGAEWRIPAPRMKMRREHVVPLARQTIAILRELYPLTGPDGFVFPQVRNPSRPISDNTLGSALRTLGFSADQHSAHGFRSTASTLLNESGKWHPDAIERQLAHAPQDKTRAAYNAAAHMPERRKMMQAWADYLDELRSGAKVIPIKRSA